jgi:ribosomal protein L1
MMGKKLEEAKKDIEKTEEIALDAAIVKLKEVSFAKFDESVDIAVRLGVDPKKSDQMVRGTEETSKCWSSQKERKRKRHPRPVPIM